MKSRTEKELLHSLIRKTHLLDIESSTKRYSLSEWVEIFPGNFLINNMESNHNAFMNKSASDVLGYSPAEIKQMGSEYFVKFFKPEDLLGFYDDWEIFIKNKDSDRVFSFFQQVHTRNHSSWEWYFTTVKFSKDNAAQTVCVAHEVKDLKRSIVHFGNVLEDNLFFTRNYTRFCQLTAREKEVLRLMYEGMTSRQIADKLFISKLTADTHRKNIFQKLEAKSFSELFKYIRAFGLA